MDLVLLALIPLVLLAGIVLFAVGNRGWNWGTIAAAILVLLAATGYTFLAGMLAQRERAWREIVNGYQAALARERDGLTPGGQGRLVADPGRKSLADLETDKARWQRVRSLIETWRGRHWEKASFTPPTIAQDGKVKAGRITIEDVEKLTINPGAELYLFDAAPVEENGRFLGVFTVTTVNGNALEIQPTIMPPSEAERALWKNPRDEVSVYENLPVDRWMAFHRTVAPEADGEPAGPTAIPERRKTDPEELLKHLEGRLEEVRQHAEPVPQDAWPKIVEDLKGGQMRPGTYWATVEFKEAHSLPRTGGEPAEFTPGQQAVFDLETAQKLQDDGIAGIVAVERRRPLTDGQTAIRGGNYQPASDGADRPPISIEGAAFIRRMLATDITAIIATTARMKAAKTSADKQLELQEREGEDLESDREKWRTDAEAAVRVADRFEARLEETKTRLEATETAIVELGRELAGASTLLVDAIDARAPPPGRRQPQRAP